MFCIIDAFPITFSEIKPLWPGTFGKYRYSHNTDTARVIQNAINRRSMPDGWSIYYRLFAYYIRFTAFNISKKKQLDERPNSVICESKEPN